MTVSAASQQPGDGVAGAPDPPWADQLRDIQSVTDAALSALDPQSLLDALVARVKEALRADTAAVLLLDRPSALLIATAASGLEDEVQQGVRVPVGKGFAGRIAASGRLLILRDVEPGNVVNPLLLARGIRSLMGAPLRAGGEVIGVLHVGTLTTRDFSGHEADLLQLAADRAAVAVQALAAQADRAGAAALQRSLLPPALPAIAGLGMAARYAPGSGNVGGDWYDVFPLPSGEVCAVIGDVAGSGIRAAVIMGRMRSALRAYALETTDPADMLERLDRKMQHFEPEALATVLCAVLGPGLDQVRISSAGHLPPVIAGPALPARPVDMVTDILIGADARRGRRSVTVELPPGAVLCMYTDGLVERRGRFLDDGIADLCRAITVSEPEAACARAMAAMAAPSPHADDIAMLMLRREADSLAG